MQTGLGDLVPAGLDTDLQQFPSYYMTKDGWVVSLPSLHCICWIPQAYCHLIVSTATGAALATPMGIVIMLDFTKINRIYT